MSKIVKMSTKNILHVFLLFNFIEKFTITWHYKVLLKLTTENGSPVTKQLIVVRAQINASKTIKTWKKKVQENLWTKGNERNMIEV